MSEQERGFISEILATAKAHTETIEVLQEDHSLQSSSIEQKALDTFQKKYMVCNLVSKKSYVQLCCWETLTCLKESTSVEFV